MYDAARQRDDAEFELVELDDHHLPLLDEPVDAGAAQRDYERESTRAWSRLIDGFDPELALRAAVVAGVPFVMVALATYTLIDRTQLAVFSPTVMKLVRSGSGSGLGFGGVIMSDDLGDALAVQSIPTLLLWGDRDRAVSRESAQDLAGCFDQVEFQLLPGVGHLPFEECPELFVRMANSFLENLRNIFLVER